MTNLPQTDVAAGAKFGPFVLDNSGVSPPVTRWGVLLTFSQLPPSGALFDALAEESQDNGATWQQSAAVTGVTAMDAASGQLTTNWKWNCSALYGNGQLRVTLTATQAFSAAGFLSAA